MSQVLPAAAPLAQAAPSPPRTAAPPRPLPHIDSGCAGLRLTPAEFDALADYEEGCRYELIQGVLAVVPIPDEAHEDPNDVLGYLLRRYAETHPLGRALDKTLPGRYVYLPQSRRVADRVIWAGLGRRPDPAADPPTIAIEFVSRSKRDWLRDYVEKRDEFLAAGVKEYWVIDCFRRTLTVYRSGLTGPEELVVREQEAYRPNLLPGLELPLAPLLAAADEWRREDDR